MVAGVLTGLIGASGVMLVVPAFVMLGLSASESIGASLLIDAVASLVVSWTYYRNKNLKLREGAWIALGSVAGAQAGSLLSPFVPDMGLSGAFSAFLLVSAVIFWVKGAKGQLKLENALAERPPALLRLMKAHTVVSGLALGLGVGLISGLLGAGGGIMILFILVFVMGFPMHEGIGTSTFIMAITAASGAVGHAASGDLPLWPALLGALGTLVGGWLAARYANKVSNALLCKVAGVVFAALGVTMIIMQALGR